MKQLGVLLPLACSLWFCGQAIATDPLSPAPSTEAQDNQAEPPEAPTDARPVGDLLILPAGPTTPLSNLSAPSATSAVTANLVVRVNKPEEALATLINQANSLGGYLTSRSDYAVVLRVPTAQTGVFMAVAENLGRVSERLYQVVDHGAEVTRLDAQLRARREMLSRYFAVMATSTSSGVLSVEREISSLVSEIERMAGRRRLLLHQLSYAEVTVSFRFVDRQGPETSPTSSFDWINHMNLPDLMRSFRYEGARR